MDGNIQEEKAAEEKKPEVKKGFWPFVWEIIKIALIAFIIVFPIRYFLFQPFIVSGASMSPNFATGDYLIVDEISYRLSAPQRGDVVVFNAGFIPGYEGQRFIKRVIGLPGETVDIASGKVEIISGSKTTVLNETYLPANLETYGFDGSSLSPLPEKVTLTAGQYFVMGDNRLGSYDSRYWGILPKSDIIGKAALRIFPVNELGEIPHPAY